MVYTHFVGFGKWDIKKKEVLYFDSAAFDLTKYIAESIPKSMNYKNNSYVFEDCIKEVFVKNMKQVAVVHVMYVLDTDAVNFKSFVEEVKPSDFALAK